MEKHCKGVKIALHQPRADWQVNALYLAELAATVSIKNGSWSIETDSCEDPDAFNVAEYATAVSDPDGLVVVFISQVYSHGEPSPKKILSNCITSTGDILDLRVTDSKRIDGAWNKVMRFHAKHWSALERLAACAED